MNLKIVKCNTATLNLEFTKDDLATTIAGATVYFTAKKNLGQAQYDIYKEITTHSDAPNGKTEIELTSSDTDINEGNYFYDITVRFANDKIHTFTIGKLTIAQGTSDARDSNED